MLVDGMRRNQQDATLLVDSGEVLEQLAAVEENIAIMMTSNVVPELVAMHAHHGEQQVVLRKATSLLLQLLAFSRKPLHQIIEQGGLTAVMASLRDKSAYVEHTGDALALLLLMAKFRCEMIHFMQADAVTAIVKAFANDGNLDVQMRAVKAVSSLADLKENTVIIASCMVQKDIVTKLQSAYELPQCPSQLQGQVINALVALIRSFGGQNAAKPGIPMCELDVVISTPIISLTGMIASTTETNQKPVIDRMVSEDGFGAVAAVLKIYPRLPKLVTASLIFVSTVIAKNVKLAERVASGPFAPATIASMQFNADNLEIQTNGAAALACLATTDRTARLFVDQGALEVLNSCHSTHRTIETVVTACTQTFSKMLAQDIDLGLKLLKAGCVKEICTTFRKQPTFKRHCNLSLKLLQTLVEEEGIIDPLTDEQKAEVAALWVECKSLVPCIT